MTHRDHGNGIAHERGPAAQNNPGVFTTTSA
jgi:hypothetical protein